jgi:hypothetical protein
MMAALPALAQEQEPQQAIVEEIEPIFVPKDFEFSYSPEHCDFIANFPEKPLVTYQCEDDNDNSTCFNLVSYTKVIGLSSTVKVELICNPATQEMYEYFEVDIMEASVRAMTKDKVIKEFNIDSRDGKGFRQTGIVAQGRQGLHDTLYIAQLWIAENSILSVEAELMGEQTAEADFLFANILRNIGHLKDIKGEEFAEKKIQAYLEKKKPQEAQDKETKAEKQAP